MSNELQNDDMYLQGDLGTVRIGSASYGITKTFKANDGTFAMTVTPFPTMIHITDNRNPVFDIDKINDRLKELGAVEDIPCEEIKSITND